MRNNPLHWQISKVNIASNQCLQQDAIKFTCMSHQQSMRKKKDKDQYLCFNSMIRNTVNNEMVIEFKLFFLIM